MTIQICDQFWLDCLTAKHNFSTQTFKIALYDSSAGLSYASVSAYSATNEISGTGYTTGGATLTVSTGYPKLELINDVYHACVRFDDVTWSSATLSDIKQALIYNSTTSGNPAVALFTFAEAQSVSTNDFTLVIPVSQRPIINIKAGGASSS